MAQGLGLGPVFAYEWLTRSRRWQSYALRGLFVLALLFGLGLVWRSSTTNTRLTVRQQLAEAGESFFFTMTITQLSLILLAAPAATAGAICLDKARGTLAHVMVTDLTDREVVLGKLAARLVPVLNLVACALPVAALGTLMGGIDPMALTASILIAGALAILGCALALMLSVWMSKAHEVMIVVFAIWILWLLALPIFELNSPGFWAPDWLKVSNPFWLAVAPYNAPGMTGLWEPVGFFGVCLVLGGGLAGLSVARVRPVYLHQANRVPKAIKGSRLAAWFRHQVRWWPGPSLDTNPVLWREWHRNRPSKATRFVWGLYIVITSIFSVYVIVKNLSSPSSGWSKAGTLLNALQVTIGMLLVAASTGTVLSEERVRGSLDVLLSTPMSTRSIIWGKWWGAFRKVPWLAFWPTMVAFSLLKPETPGWMVALVYLLPALIIAEGAALSALGLALATWISRTGRAATWTISIFVASVIGWPILGALVFNKSGAPMIPREIVIMGSPFYNPGAITDLLQMPASVVAMNPIIQSMQKGIGIGSIVWVTAYGTIALGLYVAIMLTFDRCLGRTSERMIQPPPFPRPKAKPVVRSEAWVGELD